MRETAKPTMAIFLEEGAFSLGPSTGQVFEGRPICLADTHAVPPCAALKPVKTVEVTTRLTWSCEN